MVPESEWSLDYATPKLYCTTKDGKCVQLKYNIPKDAILVEPKADEDEPRPSYLNNPNVNVKYLSGEENVVEMDSK